MSVPTKPVTYRIFSSRGNVIHAQRLRTSVGKGEFGQNVQAFCGQTTPEDDVMNVTLSEESWRLLWNEMTGEAGVHPTLCHQCRKGLGR